MFLLFIKEQAKRQYWINWSDIWRTGDIWTLRHLDKFWRTRSSEDATHGRTMPADEANGAEERSWSMPGAHGTEGKRRHDRTKQPPAEASSDPPPARFTEEQSDAVKKLAYKSDYFFPCNLFSWQWIHGWCVEFSLIIPNAIRWQSWHYVYAW